MTFRPGWIYDAPGPVWREARDLAELYRALLAQRAGERIALGPAPATSPALVALDARLASLHAPGVDDALPALVENARLAYRAYANACALAGISIGAHEEYIPGAYN